MIRAYEEKDYEIIQAWALKAGQCPPPSWILATGCFYVVDDNKPIGCGFLFLEQTVPLAVISFVFFNPEATPKQKRQGLDDIYNALEHVAQSYDKFLIMTDTAYNSIEKILNKKEYLTALEGAKHLIKILPKETSLKKPLRSDTVRRVQS